MTDSIQPSRIQFGEEIHPAKTGGSKVYSTAKRDPSLSENGGSYDVEEKAVQIANDDLNRKNKQVCSIPWKS